MRDRLRLGAGAVALLAAAGALSALSPWTAVCIVAFSSAFLLVIRSPLLGLCLYLALQPFLDRAIRVPMGQGIPDLSLGRVIIASLLIALVGRAVMGKIHLARFGLMELLIAAVPTGIALAAPASKQPLATAQAAVSAFLVPLLLYFIAKNCIQGGRELNALFLAGAILGALLTAYMVFELTTGVVLLPEEGASLERAARTYSRSAPSVWLVKGVLSDSSNFARVLTSTIPVTLFLCFTSTNRTRRTALVAVTLLQCAGLFLTLNRSGWIAALVGLAILQFAFPRLRRVLVVAVVLAVTAAALYYRPFARSALVQQRVLYNLETLNGRVPRWQAALAMWKRKPISGWGFGRFDDESGQFRTDGSRENFISPHSDYFAILVGAGLIGFAPYVLSLLAPWLLTARLYVRARAPDRRGALRRAAILTYWAALAGFLLGSLTTDLGQAIVRALVFATAGGVVGYLTTERASTEPESTTEPRPQQGQPACP